MPDSNIDLGEKISRPVAKLANLQVRELLDQDRIELDTSTIRRTLVCSYNTANAEVIPTGMRMGSEKENRNVSMCARITDHWSVADPEIPILGGSRRP
ncbi:hypothetical protein [Nocardia yamanashiensis]|uniref:hypothetical protein n=1 Tax=Nocardia yamanashiensis TaxID=209247 RepID=UPI000A52ABCF|nr:hypothetical protein [Nocardia yamanashiensis]